MIQGEGSEWELYSSLSASIAASMLECSSLFKLGVPEFCQAPSRSSEVWNDACNFKKGRPAFAFKQTHSTGIHHLHACQGTVHIRCLETKPEQIRGLRLVPVKSKQSKQKTGFSDFRGLITRTHHSAYRGSCLCKRLRYLCSLGSTGLYETGQTFGKHAAPARLHDACQQFHLRPFHKSSLT